MFRRFLQGGSQPRSDEKDGSRSQPSFHPGDLLSVLTEDGQFGVMKVLAVDDKGIHVRLYAQRFKERPRASDLHELSTKPFPSEHGNPFSFGHMPFSHSSFLSWEPQAVGSAPVSEDELKGHRMWKEADGGYF